ncbi:MAG: HIT domain-containing protein [bacterium]
MKKLYAPWRHDYVTGLEKKKDKKELVNECIFCDHFAQKDDARVFILKRLKNCGIIMNYYPYSAGHVMIIPYKHVQTLTQLTPEIRAELMEATNLSLDIITRTLKCEGTNIGLNLGKAGGGGIQEHLHIHVLPRWLGDTNFMATLAETTIISTDFHEIYKTLKNAFNTGDSL